MALSQIFLSGVTRFLKHNPHVFVFFVLFGSGFLFVEAFSQHPDTRPEEDTLATRLSESLYKIGTVTLDKDKREVYLKGKINMDKGLIEYLAVAEGGKTHESVLALNIEPIHLQTALLLLGLEFGRNLEFQGDTTTPVGDPLEIWVEWKDSKGKKVKVRGEDLVYNIVAKKSMPHINWVFSGSQILEGQFMAQLDRSIAATYHDPFAIIDHPLPTGADDTVYEVNQKVVPKVGTEVTMVVKAVKKEESNR